MFERQLTIQLPEQQSAFLWELDKHITVTVLPWQQFIKQSWQGEI